MINLLWSDLKRSVLSFYFFLAVFLFVASGLINYFVNCERLGVNPGTLTVFLHSTMLDYSLFHYTAPFIAVIPIAFSLYYNVSSGYYKHEALRLSPKGYSIVKVINGVITGSVTFLFGSTLFILICFFIDPSLSIRLYPPSYFASFQNIYNNSILCYSILVIINMMIYGALYAFFCISIFSISNSLIVTLVFPAIFYLFSSALSTIKIYSFGLLPSHTFYLPSSTIDKLIQDYGIVLLISIILYILGYRKRFMKESWIQK